MDTSTVIKIIIVLTVIWLVYRSFAPIKGVKSLSANEFENELNSKKNNIVIDVREINEYKSGFIPNAKNIPLSQLKNRIIEIPKDKKIYIYCRSGMRSKQAARVLSKQGFYDIVNLQGGIMSWKGQVHK